MSPCERRQLFESNSPHCTATKQLLTECICKTVRLYTWHQSSERLRCSFSWLVKSFKIICTRTLERTTPAVWCVMRETISSKTGLSPPRCLADLSQSRRYMSIYIFAPLWIFFLSNTTLFVQNTVNNPAFLLPFSPHVVFWFLFPNSLSLFSSHPPLLWQSPPTLYPSPCSFLLCTSLPPSLSHQAICKQGTNSSRGGREWIKTGEMGGRNEREQNKTRWQTGSKKRSKMEDGRWRRGRKVVLRRRRGMIALDTAMGVPLHGSCEVKSLLWF